MKFVFVLCVFTFFVVFCHSDSTGYREECRSAIRGQAEDFEVVYACRWTVHPEKDTWWGDWVGGDHASDMNFSTARKLKAEVKQQQEGQP